MPLYRKSTWIDAPVGSVFAFHEEPDTLERLTPPWVGAKVIERSGGIRPGGRVVLSVPLGRNLGRWVAEHTEYEQDRLFTDVLTEGPFRIWRHRHEFAPENGGTRLTDSIEFSLPGGRLADWLGGWFIRRQLAKVFHYRHQTTRRICEARLRAAAKK